MKRYLIVILGVLAATLRPVQATPFSSYLPDGKNYIDPANFNIGLNSMENMDPIRVKASTTYTISIPPDGMFPDAYLIVSSSGTLLFEGDMTDHVDCDTASNQTSCTFTTTTNEYIDLELFANGLLQFYDSYGLQDFQLEEGAVPTEYEPYVSPFTDVNNPVFQGSATFVKAYYEAISIADIIADHVLVVDDIDGDLTDQIVISNDTYTTNMNTAGQYHVTLSATDSSGNAASFILTILVKDEVSPEIQGPDVVVVDVNQPDALADLVNANYIAMDGHDGVVPLLIDVEQYSVNQATIGQYDVHLFAEDAANNEVTRVVTIDVQDQDAPTLLSNTDIIIPLSNPQTLTEVFDGLTIVDNYDFRSAIEVIAISDEYTANAMIPGTYEVGIIFSDQSSNNAHATLELTVVDDVRPTITGPSSLSGSYLTAPTLADILAQLGVTDNIDLLTMDDVQIQLDNYSNRTAETGVFQIVVEVYDTAGNRSEHTVTLTLLDDQAPTIYIDNYLVAITSEVSFSPQDALQLMLDNNELPQGQYEVHTIVDEYSGNEAVPGTYDYVLQFISDQGDSTEKEFVIRVTGSIEDETSSWDWIRPVIVYTSMTSVVAVILMKHKK